MPDPRNIPWMRLSAGGVAIVLSVLLGFAIDAWWDRRTRKSSLAAFLSSFEQELIASREDIERTLRLSVAALKTID